MLARDSRFKVYCFSVLLFLPAVGALASSPRFDTLINNGVGYGKYPIAIASEDFDEDGHADLVVATSF